MPIAVQCPECSARLNAPDAAAGKKVKCPKCGAPVAVTAPAPVEVEAVDEPEEVEPPEEPAKKPKKKVARAESEDDEDETPRRKKRPKDEDEDEEDDRPRKKGGKAEAGGGKALLFVLLGVGGLVLLGGVGAAVYFATRAKAPEVAKGGGGKGDDPQGKGAGTDTASVKVITLRARFKADFKSKEKRENEVRVLSLSANGSMVAVNDNSYTQAQVWSLVGEPQQRSDHSGRYVAFSTDGTLLSVTKTGGKPVIVDSQTGEPTDRPWTTSSEKDLRTATDGYYDWMSSFDTRKVTPFKIRHFKPSVEKPDFLDAGDDDRVTLAPPVKDGKELVFGLSRANKIRVFDFAAKKVVREFELSDPREYRSVGTGPLWSAFAVSSDGKWISVKRGYLGKEPDPIEIFDSNGALTATLKPPMIVSDYNGRFLYGRDVYIAPAFSPKDSPFTIGDIAAYDINKKAFVAAFRWEAKVVTATALSADGKMLAAGANDGSVAVWDLTQLP